MRLFLKKLILISMISSVFNPTTSASTIKVLTESNEVRIESKSCDKLLAEAKLLQQWLKQRGASVHDCQKENCIKNKDKFELNIHACLPSFVQKLHGSHSLFDGPNCWGNALYSVGILDAPTRAEDSEIEHWTNSKFCTPVLRKKELQPGDLLSIVGDSGQELSPYDSEIHSFIYASPNLVFEKSGEDKRGSYQVRNIDDILKSWDITPNCHFRSELKKYGSNHPIKKEIEKLEQERIRISEIETKIRKEFFQKIGSYDWTQWGQHEKKDPELIQLSEKLKSIENQKDELYEKQNRIMEARPCRRWVQAYRCQSVRDWLRNQENHPLKLLYLEISQIEKEVDCIYRSSTEPVSKTQLKTISDQLVVIQKTLELLEPDTDPELKQGLELRTLVLLDALESRIWLKN